MRKHPLYSTWSNMKTRCLNPRATQFAWYGGRGIGICERWRSPHGFAAFLSDMGPRPSGATLDRVNNDGNYEPGNCRWASRREQVLNSRSVVKLSLSSAQEIRERYASGLWTQPRLAKAYGVDQRLIWGVVHGKKWVSP